jgi:Flp pilus assembly protein TadG
MPIDARNSVMTSTTRSRFPRLLGRFARAERGNALVEWGLVAPVMLLLIMVIIEVSMITFINNAVEGGLKEATRWGITGQSAPTGLTKEQYIASVVKEHTYGLVSDGDITISTKVYPSFSDVGKGEPFTDSNANNKYDAGEPYTDINKNGKWDDDMGVNSVGKGGDIVAYTVDYKWTVMTPLLIPFATKDGKFDYSATVVVRNEPY